MINKCICCPGDFTPGKHKIWYAHALYGADEIAEVVKCLVEGRIAPGKRTEQFEKRVAELFNKGHAVMTNSGSSANLIACEMMGLKPGDEVITTACSFPTTVSPILLKGATAVVADSEVGTYNLNLDMLPEMVTEKTKAIMVAHLCGSINDMERISRFAKKHGLIVVEDSCDTIGSTIDGRPTGYWADMSTTSFYASHVISAGGGGGMIIGPSKEWRRKALALRDWGRAEEVSFKGTHEDEDIKRRFSYKLGDIPYDSKFLYKYMGYNLKSSEMNAAFGLAQLPKLEKWNEMRRKNFEVLTNYFKENWPEFFVTPRVLPGVEASWLSYPLTIRDKAPFSRVELLTHLEKHQIQTRLLMAGNMFKHDAYKNANFRVVGELKGVEKITRDSFVVGLHQQITTGMMDYMLSVFENFLKEQ